MDAKLAQQKIKTALKQCLKKSNHSYADVAKVWGCSVPTVKRQLGAEELPTSRLLEILEWLSLSLSDLQKLVDSEDLFLPRYTLKQNQFLAKNSREFSFLMKLYDGLEPKDIAKKYSLSSSVVDKVLIQLEKHDLIRVGAGGKIKPVYEKVPGVDGELAQVHMQRLIDRLALFLKRQIGEKLDKQARGIKIPKGGVNNHVIEVSEKTYNDFAVKARQLLADFEATAKLEQKMIEKKSLKTAFVGVDFFLCERDDPSLSIMTDIFDFGLLQSEQTHGSPLS